MNLSCAQQAKASIVQGEHAPSAQLNVLDNQDSMMCPAGQGRDELLSQVDPENVQPPDIPWVNLKGKEKKGEEKKLRII